MKKLMVILLVLTLALSAVSAKSELKSYSGLDLDMSFNTYNLKNSDNTVASTVKRNNFDIMSTDQIFFNDNFGLATGIGLAIPMSEKGKITKPTEGDWFTEDRDNLKLGFIFSVAGAFKYDIQKNLELVATAGINYQSRKTSSTVKVNDSNYTTTTIRQWMFAFEASCAARYAVAEDVMIQGGVKMDIPFSTTYKTNTEAVVLGKSTTKTESSNYSISGFSIVPFIGVVYVY